MKTKLLDRTFELESIAVCVAAFCPWLKAPAVALFSGPLGSGKTTLIAAILENCFSISRDQVASPTFTMLHEYPRELSNIAHFDLYHLKDPLDFEKMGWSEHFDGISLIEWPERLGELMPEKYIHVTLHIEGENRRRVVVHEVS